MNIKLYKWDRALEIAVQNRTHVDTVIAYRQRYLGNRAETNDRFLQFSKDIEVDWESIKAKIRADKDREEEAAK